MDSKKILDNEMKNMETSPNKRKSMSVESLKNADHTSMSVDSIKKKYGAKAAPAPQQREDIEVKLIRNKDRSVDAADPVGERTIIFNKKGGIMGSQG